MNAKWPEKVLTAQTVVFLSAWYEGIPLMLVGAFASDLPAIVSRLGCMRDIVEERETVPFLEQGNPKGLAAKVQWATAHPEEMRRMGESAHREHELKYTPERNYEMFMDIYEQAIHHANSRR